MKKEDKYENPFKNDDFKNPAKTFEESIKRVKVKIKKIKEAENKEWHENPYFNFSIEKLEKAKSKKCEPIPKIETIEELEEWLEYEDN